MIYEHELSSLKTKINSKWQTYKINNDRKCLISAWYRTYLTRHSAWHASLCRGARSLFLLVAENRFRMELHGPAARIFSSSLLLCWVLQKYLIVKVSTAKWSHHTLQNVYFLEYLHVWHQNQYLLKRKTTPIENSSEKVCQNFCNKMQIWPR